MKKEPNKNEVLTYAATESVQKAADKFGVSPKTIYQWQGKKDAMTVTTEGEFLVIRIPKRQVLREALGGLI